MTNPIFELHRAQTYDLVQSLVIKFSDEAYCNNKWLTKVGKYVDSDPTTWRYYLNLNGDYHETNVMMETISLDTQTTVQLTKETLKQHPKTFDSMKPGRPLFGELNRRYPSQRDLIKGLTNPVPFDIAHAAPDGTVLAWDTTLVEPQEESLIPNLSKELVGVIQRWHIETHRSVGTLYSAAFLVNFYKTVIDTVHVLRQEAVHSNEVHSYHLWRFLSSHGRLERYKPYLTLEQALWLYREVRHIVNNAGLDETLQRLIDNLLTKRGIRVFELEVVQDTTDPANPHLEIERIPRNYKHEKHLGMVRVTPDDINERLSQRISGDPSQVAVDNERVFSQTKDLLSTTVKTKALETFIPSAVNPIMDVEMTHLLRQWGYLALTGRYLTNIDIIEYKSGKLMSLSVRTAYQLYLCLIKMANHQDLGTYGEFGIPRVLTIHQPDIGNEWIPVERTQALLNATMTPTLVTSTKDFHALAIRQRQGIIDYDLHSQQHMMSTVEAEYRAHIHALHRDVKLTLGTAGTTEEAWLTALNPEFLEYTPEEAESFALELLVRCCGMDTVEDYDIDKIRLMLSLLVEELGSYHVRFISNELDESPLNARMEVPKVNDVTTHHGVTDIWVDLGYKYDSRTTRVLRNYQIPQFGITGNVETHHATTGELPEPLSYKAKSQNYAVVRYYHTTPPLSLIEDKAP